MSKNKKVILTTLVAVIIIISIFSIYNINKDNKNNNIDNSLNENIKSENNTKQENFMVDTKVIDKKIYISQRCRGCGKCAIIDAEHFTLNRTTGMAEVVSQNNLDSNNLKSAISMCPVGAITIN